MDFGRKLNYTDDLYHYREASNLKRYAKFPFIVCLGLEDTDPEAENLRRSEKLDQQQGKHRLARGMSFVGSLRNLATRLGVTAAVEEVYVQGAGHNNRQMTGAALKALFPHLFEEEMA